MGKSSYLSEIQGYKNGYGWVTLDTFQGTTNKTFAINDDTFYSRFRIFPTQSSSTYVYGSVYEFQCTEGIIKFVE